MMRGLMSSPDFAVFCDGFKKEKSSVCLSLRWSKGGYQSLHETILSFKGARGVPLYFSGNEGKSLEETLVVWLTLPFSERQPFFPPISTWAGNVPPPFWRSFFLDRSR